MKRMANNIQRVPMLSIAVKDMPKMKEFCTNMLGFEIITEYRQDDGHWWTSIKLPSDGLVITLSTFTAGGKLGTPGLYLLAPDIEGAHRELAAKGAVLGPITPDLYGPGSGTKWFSITDPDGNAWQIAEAAPPWVQ